MAGMDADGDLIRWTESFLSDRIVDLIIDGNQCQETAVDTGVSQGLPVLLILFPIYLSRGVIKEVEKVVEGSIVTSFTDDCG